MPQDRRSSSPFQVVPAAARLTASAWRHSAEWAVGTSLRLGSRVARTALGREATPPAGSDAAGEAPPRGDGTEASAAALRARGAELLRRSADVDEGEGLHPAYARILDNLSPDEARSLPLDTSKDDATGEAPPREHRAAGPDSQAPVKDRRADSAT